MHKKNQIVKNIYEKNQENCTRESKKNQEHKLYKK